MRNRIPKSAQALVDLGFTGLEAAVYTTLVPHSPLTGYKIAQKLGKPVANTYKAIESLQRKGAVIVNKGESRMCRAVPADELLSQLELSFRRRQSRAAETLSQLQKPSPDDLVYKLESHDQVMERCRAMLLRCKKIALLDIFPEPLAELSLDIEEATGRGLEVALKVYEPAAINKAKVVVEPAGETVLARWPGQWLTLVIDDSEFLLAFLTSDGSGVRQAIWSNSACLAWVYSSALASELVLAGVQEQIEAGATTKEIQIALKKYLRLKTVDTPGYYLILDQLGDAHQK